MVNLLAWAPGIWELSIIAFIALLLFGGARLPKLMRSIGESVTEFKKGVHGIQEEVDEASRKTTSTKSD